MGSNTSGTQATATSVSQILLIDDDIYNEQYRSSKILPAILTPRYNFFAVVDNFALVWAY